MIQVLGATLQARALVFRPGAARKKTFGEIAEAEGIEKRRIQQLIELAFLAPGIVRSVREGRQPIGLTSGWLMRHAVTPVWSEQREEFATL